MNIHLLVKAFCLSVALCVIAAAESQAQAGSQELVTVHIYRPCLFYGFGWTYKVKVGDSLKVKVRNSTMQTIQLPAGKWRFQVKDLGRSSLVLDAEAGREYYIRGSFRGGFILGVPQITEVTPEFARQEMQSLHFVKSGKVK